MTIWFTSDEHYWHTNIIKYCNRPFSSVEEMNNVIINNFNSRVSQEDTTYHIGDFTLKNNPIAVDIMQKLNGKHYFIKGSHDSWAKDEILSPYMKEIKVDGVTIVLCHYAMRVWPKSHYGSLHLYGHSHGKLPSYGLSYDVGVDNNNFFPVSFEEIKEKMKTMEVVNDGRIRFA
jgi:calcineurin-like phosphoesterase family protein